MKMLATNLSVSQGTFSGWPRAFSVSSYGGGRFAPVGVDAIWSRDGRPAFITKVGGGDRIRTCTGLGLNQTPLPVGLRPSGTSGEI